MDNQDNNDQKIVINGEEFSLDEAQNLIETGRSTLEAEQKYNTKFDKVWPEYSKSQTRLKELESELETTKAQLTEKAKAPSEGNYSNGSSNEGLTNAEKEAARRIGVVFKEDIEDKFLTQDRFNDLFKDAQANYQAQQDRIGQVLKQAEDLEQQITGSDGRPKFRKDIVMPYAASYGIGDLGEAYERMYSEDLDVWKKQQVEQNKRPSLRTLRSAGSKEPAQVRVTRDNMKDLLHESLQNPED